MDGITAFAPVPIAAVADGVQALAGGTVYLTRTRTIVAADIHFGYEEVIGGALPLWSIDETMLRLREAACRVDAREIVLLGDVVHGPHMSEGAACKVMEALATLRGMCTLTIIAGNHEGRGRAADLLGDTHEVLERDGWLLLHGDELLRNRRCIIGHLHPSLHLGAGKSVPVVLASPSLVVVPALTPYSLGLNVCSAAARDVLHEWCPDEEHLMVYGVAGRHIYPFGPLEALCVQMHAQRFQRLRIRPKRRFR